MPSSTSLSSSISQSSSPAKQKYSRPTQALCRVRDHPRAPGAEVLDPADLDVGLVDVDPVVREEVLAVEHERDGEEVAVAQALGGGDDLRRGCGSAMPTMLRSGSERDDVARLVLLAAGDAPWSTRPSSITSFSTGVFSSTWPPSLLDVVGHRLPHLARAVARVVELADQRLDLVALVAEERGLGGAEEGQALDPLGGPLGADLRGRHAPDLLGVGLEEEVEEALAEAVGDPLLEGVLAALRLDLRPEVGEHAARQLDRAELLDHVRAAQRVVEELLVPVDARHARALEELLAHDLVPEVVDLLDLGEEAVAAEVEAVAVASRPRSWRCRRPGPRPRRRSPGSPCLASR